MKQTALTALLLTLVSLPSQAHWFIKADVGGSWARQSSEHLSALPVSSRVDIDDSDLAWSLGLGYEFKDNWLLSARYLDLGEATTRLEAEVLDPQSYHQAVALITPTLGSGIAAELGYRFWEDNGFSALASGGLFRWDTDYSSRYLDDNIKHESDGTDPFVGLELEYKFSEQWRAGVGIKRYFLERNSVDTFGVSLSLSF
ncbi:porin family protein [Shewanella sp. AS16]|uniref:outer membrane beta-barrel protein n=1 Tax=Shewanella sp. AS16 TaxID=2907625 RepID=UPI001F1D15B0|nr:outer membrane beta-barrel protein [Shewanella sp. AS16]MCE9686424.1 porin family protein [Shewanella sp. AS16]